MKKHLLVALTLATAVLFLMQNCAPFTDSTHTDEASVAPITPASVLAAQAEAAAKPVLRAYCVDCHKPDSGVVSNVPDILDFAALETNNFINLGSPQTSPLYLLIMDGIEPRDGEEMTAEEVEKIRRWLLGTNIATDNIGGGDPGGGGALIPATFTNVRARVINNFCINCHGAAAGGIGAFNTYAGVMTKVVANNPNASSFYARTINTNNPMPPAPQQMISTELRDLIRRWIAAGAPNN